MMHIEFSEEAIKQLREARYNHPHPRVQRKMEVLLLKSEGLSHGKIGSIIGVSQKTLREYFVQYMNGGMESLKEIKFYRPQSELMNHKGTIEQLFRENPPSTIKEAIAKIKEVTGIERTENSVRGFLKKNRLKTFENSANTSKSRHKRTG
jgi:transposase